MAAQIKGAAPGTRVRLGKKTSNLFRGRSEDDRTVRLDASGLGGVIAVNPHDTSVPGAGEGGVPTADVQGMCTYEDLVDAVLPYGLAPTVVPELKTITLGGAVTGMGVESTSFRLGLPHEALVEMDVLTGTGDVVTCSPAQNVDLFRGFPNSYGSLGYAVRLKVRLTRVEPYVALRSIRFTDLHEYAEAIAEVVDAKEYAGERVDYLDGVIVDRDEAYLILGRLTSDEGPTSDYTRDKIFHKAIRHASGTWRDRLTIRDYLWRWDTDWFWCSRAFGVQSGVGRKLWPRSLKRSSVYWGLVRLDRRYDIEYRFTAKRQGLPKRERVVQDVEVTVDKLPEFVEWFLGACDIRPLWMCPIRLLDASKDLTAKGDLTTGIAAPWPLYPLKPGTTWVNIGFWSAVDGTEGDPGAFNRRIEEEISTLGGHKSLYSEAFYSREDFAELYGGDLPEELKAIYDPDGHFPGLYEKTVRGA